MNIHVLVRLLARVHGERVAVQAFAELNPGVVHFLDLGLAFLDDELTDGKYEVLEALMPDSLHPSSGALPGRLKIAVTCMQCTLNLTTARGVLTMQGET